MSDHTGDIIFTTPRVMRRRFKVPIYDAVLWLIVAPDVTKARRKMEFVFGPVALRDGDYDALCAYSGRSTFGLFFESQPLSLRKLSHEVFHLTHRMMDWVSANFDAEHHEQGALLNGYLMDLVCRELRRK